MKNHLFLLLLLALASCSSFERMKYRHLNKVPATPQEFSSSEPATEPTFPVTITQSSDALSQSDEVVLSNDPAENVVQTKVHRANAFTVEDSLCAVTEHAIAKNESKRNVPQRRDWSLLVGLVFLIGGLLALALCIFYYPFAGLNFLWTIAFELFTLYAAWRMIGTGITFFVTRFRSRKNYSER